MKKYFKIVSAVVVMVGALLVGSNTAQAQTPIIVTPSCPVLTPTFSIVGSPLLTLSYDADQKESLLKSSFDISVNGGNTGAYLLDFGSVIYVNQTANGKNVSNTGKLTPLTFASSTQDIYGQKLYIVAPGQIVKFNLSATAQPLRMFAGDYVAKMTSLYSNIPNQNCGSSVEVPSNQTNSKTIVGEVSSYISGFGASGPFTPGMGITVLGERLDKFQDILIDGNVLTGGYKGDANNIGFGLPASLSNGNHTLQLRSNTFGDSNLVSFETQTGSCYQFVVNLEVGSQGGEVTELQKFLNAKGFSTDVTGYFGEKTKTALMLYQTASGLPATGYFGPLTRAYVNADCSATPSVTLTSTSVGMVGGYQGFRYTVSASKPFTALNVRFDCVESEIEVNFKGGAICGEKLILNVTDRTSHSFDVNYKSKDGNSHLAGLAVTALMGSTVIGGDRDVVNVVATSHDATIKVLRSLLDLTYDTKREESLLKNTMIISVNGGTKGIYVYEPQGAMGFYDTSGRSADVNSRVNEGWKAVSAGSQVVYDNKGSKMYYIKAGLTVQFSAINTIQPKQMFAGTYIARLKSIFLNTGTDINTSFFFNVDENKSNTKTIIGEKSPYITSVTPSVVKVGDKFAVNGVRLNSASGAFGTVYIDGIKTTARVDGSKDGSVLFFALPSLSVGSHYVYVNTSTGDSNRMYFEVGGQTQPPVVVCPVGYVCVPQTPSVPQIPSCPAGYTCTLVTSPTSLPSITVTAPVAGTQVPVNGTVSAAWTQTHTSNTVDVVLVRNNIAYHKVYAPAVQGNNSFSFGLTDLELPIATNYQIQICDDTIRDTSGERYCSAPGGYFAITSSVPPTTIPSITASAPVSGQTYNPAYPLKISWNQNYASNAISIKLYGGNNSPRDLGTYPAKKGENSTSRNIAGLNLPNGTYSIEICDEAIADPQQPPTKPLCGQIRFFNIETPASQPTSATLTLVKGGSANGALGAEGTSCTSTCALTVPSDKPITISATPTNPTSMFSGWTSGCSGTNRVCSIIASTNTTVTAQFDPAFMVSVTKKGTGKGVVTGGDMNCGSTCATRASLNSSVTLTATPDAGSVFTGWSGLCTGTGTCTISSAEAKIRSVSATFDLLPSASIGVPSWLANILSAVFGN